jgi:hypothetical protein
MVATSPALPLTALLSKVEIETSGQLDLRGFLGIDPNVKPGYDSIQYVVRIKGNGTAEQFQQIHQNVMKIAQLLMFPTCAADGQLVVEVGYRPVAYGYSAALAP